MDYMVRTLCIVQARLTSSRLPKKVLTKLGDSGLTLLEHVYARLSLAQKIDKIVFAIPDTPMNDDLASFLCEKRIAYYRGSENNVLQRFFDCAKIYNPDIIVRATCDNPCVDWNIVDELIESLGNDDYISYQKAPIGTSVEVFKIGALIKSYQSAKLPQDLEHVTPYIYKNNKDFKCKSLIYNGAVYRLTVDEESDLKLVDCIYKKIYRGFPIPNIDIYNLLEKYPDLVNLNSFVSQNSI